MGKNWSMDLEHNEYEEDVELIIEDGIKAVYETEPGYYVNLVTSERFGNPTDYFVPLLTEVFGDSIQMKFIDQCGCGGYVLRVWKQQ
ncbi:CGCGG family putative rSAM-modified RiPP protein [Cytobacillus praedii]|uniref:CGCGG family putative rSAM-modified RiPP protein n=1 Tax=Cytobacillus praedii TaxID=1742358 RepID=UPI002E249E97|nr:CGCGG family rSAM-modified RiPP protein [Cytobacillus praedii]